MEKPSSLSIKESSITNGAGGEVLKTDCVFKSKSTQTKDKAKSLSKERNTQRTKNVAIDCPTCKTENLQTPKSENLKINFLVEETGHENKRQREEANNDVFTPSIQDDDKHCNRGTQTCSNNPNCTSIQSKNLSLDKKKLKIQTQTTIDSTKIEPNLIQSAQENELHFGKKSKTENPNNELESSQYNEQKTRKDKKRSQTNKDNIDSTTETKMSPSSEDNKIVKSIEISAETVPISSSDPSNSDNNGANSFEYRLNNQAKSDSASLSTKIEMISTDGGNLSSKDGMTKIDLHTVIEINKMNTSGSMICPGVTIIVQSRDDISGLEQTLQETLRKLRLCDYETGLIFGIGFIVIVITLVVTLVISFKKLSKP